MQSHFTPEGCEPITVTTDPERSRNRFVGDDLAFVPVLVPERSVIVVPTELVPAETPAAAALSSKYTVEILLRCKLVDDVTALVLKGLTGELLRAVVPRTGKPERLRRKFELLAFC